MNIDPSALWRLSPAPAPLWGLVGGGLAAISLATAVARWHPRLRGQPRVAQAVQSWVPVILAVALLVLLGPGVTWLGCAAVSVALLREGLRLVPLTGAQRRLHGGLAAVLAVAANALLALGSAPWAFGLCVVYVGLLLAPLHMLAAGPANFMARVGGLTLVLNACVTLCLFVGLLVLRPSAGRPFGGPGQACFFFVVVIFSDAMQYVGGKRWGRARLAPAISPGKTWAGVLFSTAVCALLGLALGPWLLALPAWAGAALGAAMVWVGLVGDLLISCWKRDAGVKDTGSALPGQGGVLDRCDSLLFLAPWFWGVMQVSA